KAEHLAARVVDVELARDVVTCPLEQIRDGVSNHGPAAVAHVQGTRGIRADELHHGLAAGPGPAPTEAIALLPDGLERAVPHGGREPHVEEARSGDLDVLD